MADDNIINGTRDFSQIVQQLLSDPTIMSPIGEITAQYRSSDAAPSEKSTQSIDSLLSNPDIMSKLPDVINVIKPMMDGEKSQQSHSIDKRIGLLVAMKPFLSAKRCEAIDYIARMSKLSDTLKTLKF